MPTEDFELPGVGMETDPVAHEGYGMGVVVSRQCDGVWACEFAHGGEL